MTTNSNNSNMYVATIDLKLAPKLKTDLIEQGLEISVPQYTLFSAKKKGLTVTLYQSGKLVIQGKETPEFIEFYLETNVLNSFEYSNPGSSILSIDKTPRIGIDESGKGDFFGPLVIAGVYASGEEIVKLKEIGVKDSKDLDDKSIQIIARKIKQSCAHHVISLKPLKYNELYGKFNNLNRLLAWGHATTIETLAKATGCHTAIIDQFAAEHVVETALKKKNLTIELTQRHKGEEDPVVAAASILARDAFVRDLEQLGQEYGVLLAKGGYSPKVKKSGLEFLRKHGKSMMGHVAKLHFKTLDSILTYHTE